MIRHGTRAQNEELLRCGVVPIFLQMLNDEIAIDLDDEEWLDSLVIVKVQSYFFLNLVLIFNK